MATEMTPEQRSLAEQAEALTAAVRDAEAALETARRDVTQAMKAMRAEEMSWAAIGRAFGVTPQAAMYATGASKRTPRNQRPRGGTSEANT